jgi:hypothetical protein
MLVRAAGPYHRRRNRIRLQWCLQYQPGLSPSQLWLRTSDDVPPKTQVYRFTFPSRRLTQAVGFQYPQATPTELANLPRFLDLVEGKGIQPDQQPL